jgi:hypothetical protein
MTDMDYREVEGAVTKQMERMEQELGNDAVPILIILMCRMAVKYQLDIDWIVGTIRMGYNNELPPDIDSDEVIKFDS